MYTLEVLSGRWRVNCNDCTMPSRQEMANCTYQKIITIALQLITQAIQPTVQEYRYYSNT